jgi:predicted PurR-regulated permease PerM
LLLPASMAQVLTANPSALPGGPRPTEAVATGNVSTPRGTGRLERRFAKRERVALRAALLVLVVGAAAMFWPFLPWLMLAAWFGAFARPALLRLSGAIGGRQRAATLLTLLLFLGVVGPIVGLAFSLTQDAAELVQSLARSRSGRAALEALVSREDRQGPMRLDVPTVLSMAQQHAARAMTVIDGLAGAAAEAALGLFVFFAASYVFLAEGPRSLAWIARNSPIADRHLERFSAAFLETGRGLFVSVGLSGLVQAVLATIVYFALDIPRAPVLGVLTLIVSVIPSVGTALIWVPVTIGLALSGRTTDAIILGVLGTFVVSSADNVLRPIFARWGKLELHALVVLLAMLGGLAVFGGWGLLLGPLIVRWLVEALRIAREERVLE